MYALPDELWGIIKDFIFDWKKSHKLKMEYIFKYQIDERFNPIYQRWTSFPPWTNTNDIIEEQYPGPMVDWMIARPPPNLPLTSITWNIQGNGGWWCGYGWKKNNWALILGNESKGISPGLKPFINERLSIPNFGKAESLNVTIATAIFCSEYVRS